MWSRRCVVMFVVRRDTLTTFQSQAEMLAETSQLRDGCKCAISEGRVARFAQGPFRMTKTSSGNFFEDFRLGQTHPPRHAAHHDAMATFRFIPGCSAPRFAVQSSAAFAKAIGYREAPLDDLLVFHIVFGKTVPDVSLNAVANLGYAGMQFLAPVFAGDTLSATSEVIGLKENSNRKTGIVYVRTRGVKQDGTAVLEYVRWVMVRKRDESAPAPGDHVPRLPTAVEPKLLGGACPPIDVKAYDFALAGSPYRFGDYRARREDRPRRRHHRRGGRAHDRDAALSEHRAHPLRRVLGGAGPLRQAADLWRARHLARPRDLVQRACQRLPHRRDQRRPPRRAAVRGRHGVRMVGGAGGERSCRGGATSARCACARSRRRTARARISHTRTARNTTPPFCSIWITGR